MDDQAKPYPEEEARARLAAIVETTDDAIIGKTLDGTITSWNRGAEQIYGYRASEVIGRDVALLAPPERQDELRQVMGRVRQGKVVHLETERLTKDGRRIEVSLTISPIRAADGSLTGCSTIARDITEHTRLERKLRESEKRYQTQIELAADAIVVLQYGRFVYANCAALSLYGARSLKQLQEHTVLELVHPDERAAIRARYQMLMRGEEAPRRDCRLLTLDGRVVPVDTSSVNIEYRGKPSIQVIARDISERRRAEEEREALLHELEFQRAQFETVLRQMPIGVVIAEAPTGRVTYNNEASGMIFGQDSPQVNSLEDYHKWPLMRLDGTPLTVEEYPVLRALMKGERVIGEELQITRGDGSRGIVSINAAPISDPSGRIVSGVAAFTDITEKVEAAQALSQSEERLKLALDATGMGSCDMDIRTGQGIWNQRHFRLLGYQPPESGWGAASMEMWLGRIHPDDLNQVNQALEEARTGHTLFRSEHRIVRADNGHVLWMNVLGRFGYDALGVALNFLGVIFDVTERKDAEEKLRESELRHRLLFETSVQGIVYHSADDRIIMVNPALEQIVGRGARELLGKTIPELGLRLEREDGTPFPPQEIPCSVALRTGLGVRQVVLRMENPETGEQRWLSISSVPLYQPGSDRPYQVYATVDDITSRKRAEEALRASEAKFRCLFESNLIAVFFWKKDGTITDANQAYCDLVGFSHRECRAGLLNWLEATPPEQVPRDRAAIEEIMARGLCKSYEKEFLNRSDGRRIPVLCAGARMTGAESDGIALAIDLTELKRAEQALKDEVAEKLRAIEELHNQQQLLIRQGRLAALGEMIGNIAHQWRQPLNTLALIIQELSWYYTHEQFSKEYLDANVTRAMQVINHMSKTIDGFRNFFEPDKEQQDFKVADVLAQTVSMVEAAFGELRIGIAVEADPDLVLHGCPNEFSQVILNILVNAKDALLERKVAEPRVEVRLFREGGQTVLTIADNGGGIPPEIVDKIFDPYFTTKGPDRGTGIGLFMSKTIIEKNMQGALSVRNTETGAEFRIEV